jgi:hypothetical protein
MIFAEYMESSRPGDFLRMAALPPREAWRIILKFMQGTLAGHMAPLLSSTHFVFRSWDTHHEKRVRIWSARAWHFWLWEAACC